tara:strand:+ start:5342 stop:5656 length:315 start_codon:yes stop_codon:yes gene_type:complete
MTLSEENVQNLLDIIFDEQISEILAEMQNTSQKCSFLQEKFDITPSQLDEKLSLLIKHQFVRKNGLNLDAEYSVDSEKLSELIEKSHNFENIDNGLAKMDGYLN